MYLSTISSHQSARLICWKSILYTSHMVFPCPHFHTPSFPFPLFPYSTPFITPHPQGRCKAFGVNQGSLLHKRLCN